MSINYDNLIKERAEWLIKYKQERNDATYYFNCMMTYNMKRKSVYEKYVDKWRVAMKNMLAYRDELLLINSMLYSMLEEESNVKN